MNGSSFLSTRGRCSRGMYNWTSLGIALVLVMLRRGLVSMSTSAGITRGTVGILWCLVVIVAHVTWSFQFVKRLHDRGMPGWNYWLLLIPFYGVPYMTLDAAFQKGNERANKYGPDPLAEATRTSQLHEPLPYLGPQLVGRPCVHCQQTILVLSRAALCKTCEQPVHLACRKDHRSTAHPKSSSAPAS